MSSFPRYWLPLLLWMLIIFCASADAESTAHTSRFLEPFLRWLNPGISAESIDTVRWVVRKGAHMTEYGILAWLWWRALRKPVRNDARPWSWRAAWAAFGIVVLYAVTDEVHQTFVPNRTGSPIDVAIDSAGAAFGIFALWIRHRTRAGRNCRN